MTPPVREFTLNATHRLIPSRYSEGGTVLEEIADHDAMLDDIIRLDGATNDRIQGEQHGLASISTFELVYGIPNSRIVNAAFTHTSGAGCRFNDETRGAWYAAEELKTSVAEVTYHKARRLAQIVAPDQPYGRPGTETSTYDDWLADFRSAFHELEPAAKFANCLQPEPVPQCYLAPQQVARQLLEAGSNGIVYPSVRRARSRCVACFRPALVYNLRRTQRLEITFVADVSGYRHKVRTIGGA